MYAVFESFTLIFHNCKNAENVSEESNKKEKSFKNKFMEERKKIWTTKAKTGGYSDPYSWGQPPKKNTQRADKDCCMVGQENKECHNLRGRILENIGSRYMWPITPGSR